VCVCAFSCLCVCVCVCVLVCVLCVFGGAIGASPGGEQRLGMGPGGGWGGAAVQVSALLAFGLPATVRMRAWSRVERMQAASFDRNGDLLLLRYLLEVFEQDLRVRMEVSVGGGGACACACMHCGGALVSWGEAGPCGATHSFTHHPHPLPAHAQTPWPHHIHTLASPPLPTPTGLQGHAVRG
jgi:hypothetical protein